MVSEPLGETKSRHSKSMALLIHLFAESLPSGLHWKSERRKTPRKKFSIGQEGQWVSFVGLQCGFVFLLE